MSISSIKPIVFSDLSITQVISLGPIVFSDEDTGVLIGVTGLDLNWYSPRGHGKYEKTSSKPHNRSGGLYKLNISDAMDLAEEWFVSVTKEDTEEYAFTD